MMEDGTIIDKERLINLVKKYEFLYNKADKMYKHKLKCAKAWEKIAEEMEITGKCDYANQVGGGSPRIHGGRALNLFSVKFTYTRSLVPLFSVKGYRSLYRVRVSFR